MILIEQGNKQIHIIYEPGSFAPMIRIEGKKAPPRVSLASKIKERYRVNIDPASIKALEETEHHLRQGELIRTRA